MSAKRRSTKSNASNSDDPEHDSEEYRQKRMRNNEAVKKSREKTNKTAKERKERVELLKRENLELEVQIRETTKNIEVLKNLLLSNASDSPEKKRRIEKILAECDTDD